VRIAVATARATVGTDEDKPLLLAALSAAGADVEVVAWDDPVADWSAFDLAGGAVDVGLHPSPRRVPCLGHSDRRADPVAQRPGRARIEYR
jgi:hypothetical protein